MLIVSRRLGAEAEAVFKQGSILCVGDVAINAARQLGWEKCSMSGRLKVDENLHPEVQKALFECMQGARAAEVKADHYLVLSQGETDDAAYEACRSMYRFYSTMREYFLEEQRAIATLLQEHKQCLSPQPSVAA